jgi:hypothetical protein
MGELKLIEYKNDNKGLCYYEQSPGNTTVILRNVVIKRVPEVLMFSTPAGLVKHDWYMLRRFGHFLEGRTLLY